MDNNLLVAIDECRGYSNSEISAAVKKVCHAASFPPVAGKRVLIKPNILSDVAPDKAVTTHPEFVRAVIQLVQEQGGIPVVGDSPPLHRPVFTGSVCGIRQVVEDCGAEWSDFSHAPRKITINRAGNLLRRKRIITVAAETENCDLIITLPKMKTHQLLYMTGAVKNLFGLVPGFYKAPYHLKFPGRRQFSNLILDLYKAVLPVFSIMDGITAMEGPGPNAGSPRHMGVVLASENALALDYSAADIMGYDPMDMPLIQAAVSKGLLHSHRTDFIHYPLKKPDTFRKPDFRRIQIEKNSTLLQTGLSFLRGKSRYKVDTPKPIFNSAACTSCGMCVEICPNSALRLDSKGIIQVDYNNCIRCYCCHEVCNFDAISIDGAEKP